MAPAVLDRARPAAAAGRRADHARRAVDHLLRTIKEGQLVVHGPDGTTGDYGNPDSDWAAGMTVTDDRLFARVLRDGSLGLGESYMDGWWHAEEDRVVDVIGILLRSDLRARSIALGFHSLIEHIKHAPGNALKSTANVHHHYDLGNAFFSRMLDASMTYSCGIVDDLHRVDAPENSIDRMQARKLELVCRKIGLSPGDRLVDIGCGWGGLLFHAAERHGAIATGITLSERQAEWIERKIDERGLGDRVRVILKDYRDLEGEFDAFVSVGMFEHVGDAHYGGFMRKAASLLKPGGRGLLHTIGMQHRASGWEMDPWLAEYIFPGAHIPSLDRIVAEMQEADLLIAHVENFKSHYAETLRKWKKNVDLRRREIAKADRRYDDRFFRMIDYYLQSCEAGFRHGTLQLYQVLFTNGRRWTLPLRLRFGD